MKTDRNNTGHYITIDTPSDLLFTCFYCGEIASTKDHVPPLSRFHDYYAIYNQHRPIQVPCCGECNSLLGNTLQQNIYKRVEDLKIKLTTRYKKIMRYNDVWDEDSVDFCEFTGDLKKFLDGVKSSYEVIERRLNWQPWPLTLDGEVIDVVDSSDRKIVIGKLNFATIDHFYHHTRKVDKIPQKYLENVLSIVGYSRLEYGYNFCKANKVKTEKEMRVKLEVLKEIIDELEV